MRPVVLLILDGWGYSPETKGNAIAAAQKPNMDFIEKNYPFTMLQAAGVTVGLPWGEPGNSEVGHIAIGTGQIWHQPLTKITLAIQNGSFFQNPVLKKAASHARENNSAWHLVGLLGSGSVHSYIDHLYALVETAQRENVREVWLHLFTDGQDSPPKEAAAAVKNLEERLKWLGAGKISGLIGRFYGMDRDQHWDRVEKAYRLMVDGQGEKTIDFAAALKKQYSAGKTDNYIEPLILTDPLRQPASPELQRGESSSEASDSGQPQGLISDNDVVIVFNFREDRVREITRALARPDFNNFTTRRPKNLFVATLTQYEPNLPTEVIFPPLEIKHTLSEMIATAGQTQFKIAETEKYAHITYFFSGGQEKAAPGEDRKLIRSAATAHFNETPEMKAREIGSELIKAIKSNNYDFLLANFANADMLGHTGDYQAVVKGVEIIDEVVGEIMKIILERQGVILITSDHGNAEEMINLQTGEPNPEHTSNPVPCYLIMDALKNARPRSDSTPGESATGEKSPEQIAALKKNIRGLVTDVAATVLDLMRIPVPGDMDGQSLLPLFYKTGHSGQTNKNM